MLVKRNKKIINNSGSSDAFCIILCEYAVI